MKNVCLILVLLLLYSVNAIAFGSPYFIGVKSYGAGTDLLLEDYEGKRIGYDFVNKKDVMEIQRDTGGYIHDYSDYSGEPTREIDYRSPKSGLYKLQIYEHQDKTYSVRIYGTNEIMESFETTIHGKLLKGEVQNIEILYSEIADQKTTATKVLDLKVYEREVKAIFKNDSTDINKIKKELFENINKAKKYLKKDTVKAKEFINNIVGITTIARREFLVKSGRPQDLSVDYKFDGVNTWEWYRDNILKYDILINDAKELIEQIK